jgi:hypothetical protein
MRIPGGSVAAGAGGAGGGGAERACACARGGRRRGGPRALRTHAVRLARAGRARQREGGNLQPDRRIASTTAREAERVARVARVQLRRTEVRLTPASAACAQTHVGCKHQLAGSHEARNARARSLASRSSCDVRGRERRRRACEMSFFLSGLFVLQAR